VISDNLNYSTDYKRRDIIIPILFLAILSMLEPLYICYVVFSHFIQPCAVYHLHYLFIRKHWYSQLSYKACVHQFTYSSIDIHSYCV